MFSFIDTHAHLTDKHFTNMVNDIISELNNNSVSKVFSVGTDLKSITQCIKLADHYPCVYAIIGIHPSDINQLDEESLDTLRLLSKHPKVIAIGEIGLDYHYTTDNIETQKKGLLSQLKLAHELKLPIIFHVRDAFDDLYEILSLHQHLLQHSGVIHCFGYDYDTYKKIESLGLYISVGGSLTYKNSHILQKAVARIPLNKILLETDSPYLTPIPYRGKNINQPKYVTLVASKIAELKNISLEQVAKQTTDNCYTLFKKLKK